MILITTKSISNTVKTAIEEAYNIQINQVIQIPAVIKTQNNPNFKSDRTIDISSIYLKNQFQFHANNADPDVLPDNTKIDDIYCLIDRNEPEQILGIDDWFYTQFGYSHPSYAVIIQYQIRQGKPIISKTPKTIQKLYDDCIKQLKDTHFQPIDFIFEPIHAAIYVNRNAKPGTGGDPRDYQKLLTYFDDDAKLLPIELPTYTQKRQHNYVYGFVTADVCNRISKKALQDAITVLLDNKRNEYARYWTLKNKNINMILHVN